MYPYYTTYNNTAAAEGGAVKKKEKKMARAINRKLKGDIIGEIDDWRLEKIEQENSKWVILRLVNITATQKQGLKHSFTFGWNGDRFSQNGDFDLLCEQRPDLLDFVWDIVVETAA